jgi:hypothetical protein
VLWPWELPPSPAFFGMSGGPSLGLTVDVMAVCMNGAWLPVCPLGGPVDDLPVFGAYGRKVFCDEMAHLIVSLRRSPLCLPIILPLVPLVWGGCPRARLQLYALLCAASATDALAGGGCPCAHALLCYSS